MYIVDTVGLYRILNKLNKYKSIVITIFKKIINDRLIFELGTYLH